ncbi:hypothetical protein M7I_4757 [Glarea lozoyensis 74030]|uniref:Uncharacterized protein n=1 Tax=Glarea lozoyensis (strain ATCC 74030 / MF5533) TaxID=1104152 RepID=H0EQ14_GLAL7|nr:hypothetical protein M7I_4757 [Glarea lozoyensis 74030]
MNDPNTIDPTTWKGFVFDTAKLFSFFASQAVEFLLGSIEGAQIPSGQAGRLDEWNAVMRSRK